MTTMTKLRELATKRAEAVTASFTAADEQSRSNAGAEVHWIDREIVRLALELVA